MIEINPNDLVDNAKYRLQYVDYEPDTWTVWTKFTHRALEEIYDDQSISKVQIQSDGDAELILELDVI